MIEKRSSALGQLMFGGTIMLARVLEPEAMDTAEEASDYDGMDHSEVNERFVADFLRTHGPCRGGEILDVGTGPARIPIALCRAERGARVLGVDMAAAMIDLAWGNVRSEGLSGRVRLATGDAKALKLADGGFEAVISNSIIHHIPEPAPVLAEMARMVAPEGTLMVRDLARPEDLDTFNRLVVIYAGGELKAARALFAASLRAAMDLDEVRAMVSALGLPPGGVSMTSDRHWTWVWKRSR